MRHAHLTPTSPDELASLQRHVVCLDRQVFDLESLFAATTILQQAGSLSQVHRLLLHYMGEVAETACVAIVKYDEDAEQFEVVEQRGSTDQVVGTRFGTEDGLVHCLLTSGETVRVLDIAGRPRFPELFARHGLHRLGSVFWVPMVCGHRLIGFVSIGASETTTAPPQSRFLSALAQSAAGSIHRLRLEDSIHTVQDKLSRSVHNLSTLMDVTRALGGARDLTSLIKLILNRAISCVRAEKGSLMLLDEHTGDLVLRVVQGLDDKELEEQINNGHQQCRTFRPGEGVAGTVLAEGRTVRMCDVADDTSFTHARWSHVTSILCVPLRVDNETIGVINITNRRGGGGFAQEDEALLEALASQAAVAIARTRLYQAAITDDLTQLYNRAFTMHRLQEEFRRATRYQAPLTIAMCDLDHFRQINNVHGHPVGDEVIRSVAQAMRATLRGDIDIAGRYGGEEFILVLPETSASGALPLAERLRQAIEDMDIHLDGGGVARITMSFGIASYQPGVDEDIEGLVQRADSALYRSKNEGRNRITLDATS